MTEIPLEPIGPDAATDNTRPPWLRPVRKKTPSAPRSTHSGESPSQHSSPEAFSPSDFFADPNTSYPQASTSASGIPTPRQYQNGNGNGNTQQNTSPFMGMDISREDGGIYMSPTEAMALFNDSGVDVGSLFSSEYMQPDGSVARGTNSPANFQKMSP